MTAFVDLAPESHAAGSAFWSAVTGYPISTARGDHGEFTTLVPHPGHEYLKIQRLAAGPNRLHLDLHVDDVRAAADHAVYLGATEVADNNDWIVVRSPAGIVFCYVDHPGGDVPEAVEWPGGHRSRVDQVCLDIPPASFDTECHFWAAVTDRELGQSKWFPEFRNLERPATQPLRFLLQRLQTGHPGAHFDVASTNRAAEVERNVALGARVEKVNERWTVLRDPAGSRYCVIDRPPA